jgi:tetratricopeptide (TPR) repeat protein
LLKTKDQEKQKNKKNRQPSSGRKFPRWFYIVLVLIPIVFLFLLEVSLRLLDYGRVYDQWISMGKDKLTLNPEIAHRYFYTTENIPSAGNNYFDANKKGNSFRIFIMGGSSAAGFPYSPNGSFARYIKKRFEGVFPQLKIEVVNIAMSAINSYSIRDMVPGVLDQKPDLIIIYAGHNEYYGALGVGSVETLGDTRFLVNTVIWLNRFKTFEFMRDLINSISKLFSPTEKMEGTLMARMSQEQMIIYHSELYYAGINQFEGNMRDILEMTEEKNVPVILGTLVSNLKDQKPFKSIRGIGYSPAEEVFYQAKTELNNGSIRKADSLFRFAKDLDALRWRASEELNRTIERLGSDFNYPVLKLDSALNTYSIIGIAGDDLITDHLHPNLRGYQIIGKEIFEAGLRSRIFPADISKDLSFKEQDSITLSDYQFTELDSTIAAYQIIILKSDWPYTNNKLPDEEKLKALNMQNYTDTLAYLVGKSELSWEAAHLRLAQRYLTEGDEKSFLREINATIDEYPFDPYPYEFAANRLINLNMFDDAYLYLQKLNHIKQSAYSTKWLGIIDLLNNKVDRAINYLSTSLNYNASDAHTLYNLAGAYSMKKDYKTALQIVNRCLQLEPDYSMAKELQQQLLNAANQNR